MAAILFSRRRPNKSLLLITCLSSVKKQRTEDLWKDFFAYFCAAVFFLPCSDSSLAVIAINSRQLELVAVSLNSTDSNVSVERVKIAFVGVIQQFPN